MKFATLICATAVILGNVSIAAKDAYGNEIISVAQQLTKFPAVLAQMQEQQAKVENGTANAPVNATASAPANAPANATVNGTVNGIINGTVANNQTKLKNIEYSNADCKFPYDPYQQGGVVRSYCRGAGKAPSGCAPDRPDYQGGLCYKKCDEGFTGNGPVCWSNCPDKRWRTIGVSCYLSTVQSKPRTTRPRGVGQLPTNCGQRYGIEQEYKLGMCYIPCAPGYHGVGHVCYLVN